MTDAPATVSPLCRRMIDDMSLRNLSPATQRSYLHAVAKFSRGGHQDGRRQAPLPSPDLNPIEQFFAKLKHHMRDAAERTFDALCKAIARILPTLSVKECRNFFEHAGYGRT